MHSSAQHRHNTASQTPAKATNGLILNGGDATSTILSFPRSKLCHSSQKLRPMRNHIGVGCGAAKKGGSKAASHRQDQVQVTRMVALACASPPTV